MYKSHEGKRFEKTITKKYYAKKLDSSLPDILFYNKKTSSFSFAEIKKAEVTSTYIKRYFKSEQFNKHKRNIFFDLSAENSFYLICLKEDKPTIYDIYSNKEYNIKEILLRR